ncbi:MAG: serine--tRNA ligase [Epsilonproteobacteria bacterium]|nr:serine--tRNA ligase [Campylobacterota bacterium]
MIDLQLLRKDPELIKKSILTKEPSFDVDRLIELDGKNRQLKIDVESIQKQKNDLAKLGKQGLTQEIKQQSIEFGKQLKVKQKELESVEQELKTLWLSCPNIPYPDLPIGNKEANKVVKTIGEKPNFSFEIKNHLELNEALKWLDFDTGAKISGAQFVIYKGLSLKIMYALVRMMIKNNTEHGFQPILPPYLVNEETLYNAGNLPKFEGDYYRIADEKLCLIPTSEVALTNLHTDSILSTDELPVRYTSWTSCFRKEAGGYGSQDRGLIRIHQFEKVELYSLCHPDKSPQELDHMVSCAEKLLQQLGLHYQVSMLATQDCSFQSAKTFDIEVWLPGQDRYYEVSSCSNCTDFQARRAKIRHRSAHDQKPELVHTLNASSLALPRLVVALMENYQQADGSIALPQVLLDEMKTLW